MADNTMKTTFQDLPGEILDNIAGHLDNRSFAAFRQTSRFVQGQIFPNYIDRHLKSVKLDLSSLENIRHEQATTLERRLQGSIAGLTQMERIIHHDKGDFNSPVVDLNEHNGREIYDLLKELFDFLPSLETVEVAGWSRWSPSAPGSHSVAMTQLLRVLRVDDAARFTSRKLDPITLRDQTLASILQCHTSSLKTLDMTCVRVRCHENAWVALLPFIANQMSLDKLKIWGLSYVNEPSLLLHDEARRRVTRAWRNADTQKIEHYNIGRNEALISGSEAVTRAVAYIVPRMR